MFAQSHDSVPPAPALMPRMQLLLSCGLPSRTASSSASNSLANRPKSRSSSCRCLSCSNSGSASASSIMTRKSSSCRSALRSGSIFLRREPASSISLCACSRLFQKVSLAISASRAPRRFCTAGTSKKPPQHGELFTGGSHLCFERVKHSRNEILLNPQEGKGIFARRQGELPAARSNHGAGGAARSPMKDAREGGQRHATPPEPIAVAMVNRRLAFLSGGNQGHSGDHEARRVNVARWRAQELSQPAAGIDPTGQTVVRAADQRQAVFHRAKDRVGRLLPLRGSFAEPTVVGEVQQKINVVIRALARQTGNDILETDQHAKLHCGCSITLGSICACSCGLLHSF